MRNTGATNQGVLVSLIIFVLLTLIFGVTTYFGFKGLKEKTAELTTAQGELSTVVQNNEKLLPEYNDFLKQLGFTGYTNASEIVALMDEDIATALAGTGSTATSYKQALETLNANIASTTQEIASNAALRDQAIADANGQIDAAKQNDSDFLDTMNSTLTQQNADMTKVRDGFNTLTQDFNDETVKFDTDKIAAKAAFDAARQEERESREKANRIADINIDLSARIDELSDAKFTTPDGMIVSCDQAAKLTRLNIGSAEAVRPLLTFNVYAYNVLEQRDAKVKGQVQVLRDISEHACIAKIITDNDNDPIMPGDVVYTSLWKPYDFEEFALDCRLDINGDGLSDMAEVINLVESRGGKVVAYLDDDGVLHGKVTPRVTRLIIPDRPLVDILAEDDKLSEEDRSRIVKAEGELKELAQENGVRQMRLDAFLVRSFYKDTYSVMDHSDKTGSNADDRTATIVGNEPSIPIVRESDPAYTIDTLSEVIENPEEETSNGGFRKREPR
ncbi:MAG: hypothetical protein Q4G03_04975 [Planctomycetia bacterium]|nr:hypothetical protein [Planctomycetia bacterium]